MRGDRKKRIAEQIAQLAADFFRKEAGRKTLLTVTRADISRDFKNATVFLTVLPADKEDSALAFAKRHGKEFRSFLKKSLNVKIIPFVDFQIDKGEKNFYKILEEI